MAITTNVPPPTWTPQGFVAQLESAILAGVQADFQFAFGGVLNFTTNAGAPTNATPQAQLADGLTAMIGMVQDLFILYTNLVDPALSFGRMHDAIARIYYITRFSGTPSLCMVQCTGALGTIIPLGAQVQDQNGNQWVCSSAGTIPYLGVISLPFVCLTPGPVACAAGAMQSTGAGTAAIVTQINGWDSINNSAAAIVGQNAENDQAFEVRRYQSTAINGRGFTQSMRGNLRAITGVIDAYVISNTTSGPLTTMGVTLPAYSVWITVQGGNAATIAQTIFDQVPPCPMSGNTTVVVQDTQQGQSAPYPSYSITFQTPIALPILVSATIANLPSVPSNALSTIQGAIVSAFSGLDLQGYSQSNQPVYGPLISWPSIFSYRLAQALNKYTCWNGIQVVEVLVGTPNDATSANITGTVATLSGVTTLTVTAIGSTPITPGMALMDLLGNVPGGVLIGAQQSGTSGGTGTYLLTGAGSIFSVPISQAMYGVLALSDEESVPLSQFPSISANNVYMTLQ